MRLTDGAMQPYALTVDKFLDHAAKWHPDSDVVTRGLDGAISRIGYAALRDRAKRVSSVLAGLGIGVGDRVATLAWNTQAHLEAWYAIMGIGATCHTLNPRLPAAQLTAMIDKSGARILIVSADLAGLAGNLLADAAEAVKLVTIDGPAPAAGDAEALATLAEGASDEIAWGRFDEGTACGLCFTSGTTGAPKGVTYTHRGNYLHTLRQLQADVTGMTSRDTVMPVVPMFHANAWGLPFSAPVVGARLVLPGRAADGASLAQLIAQEGVTLAAAVPTVWIDLFDHLDASGLELPSLKRIMVGGAPMPDALMRRIERRGVEVQTTWGMTELSPLGTATPPDDPKRDGSLSGRPAMGLDLMVSDAGGEPLPSQREVEGHLWVRGHSVVERYLGETAPATHGGWFATGDLARIDTAGRLAITGRAKDLIKSGGEWINPAEIEAVVSAHPDVAMAVVIGRAHEKWGERPILLIEPKAGAELDDEELLAPVREAFAGWWVPDEVIRLPAMPLAATGKVDKLRLRTEYSRT